MQVPEEEKYLNTEAELHSMIVECLAGRAAEELVFETVTTGASNDIEKATKIARAMVTQYGMSKKFGLMGLEVSRILKECYEEAKKILEENRFAMDEIAKFLIEKETITGKEFMKILSEVKEKQSDSNVKDNMEAGAEPETEVHAEPDSVSDAGVHAESDSETKAEEMTV